MIIYDTIFYFSYLLVRGKNTIPIWYCSTMVWINVFFHGLLILLILEYFLNMDLTPDFNGDLLLRKAFFSGLTIVGISLIYLYYKSRCDLVVAKFDGYSIPHFYGYLFVLASTILPIAIIIFLFAK